VKRIGLGFAPSLLTVHLPNKDFVSKANAELRATVMLKEGKVVVDKRGKR